MSRSGTGPFIYQGSGKKQSVNADIAQKSCVKSACMIQQCLAKFQYKEERCQVVIDAWKSCCDRARQQEKEQQLESHPSLEDSEL